MSRGLGKVQRALFRTLHAKGRPMTFVELRGGDIGPTLERSLRRALKRMVDEGVIRTIGSGGRSDPIRYFIGSGLVE